MEKIDVKTAVESANRYFRSLAGMIGSINELSNIRLEEVELSDDKRYWLITLGFDRSDRSILSSDREYKLFKINSETGEVEAMKIREV